MGETIEEALIKHSQKIGELTAINTQLLEEMENIAAIAETALKLKDPNYFLSIRDFARATIKATTGEAWIKGR